MEKNDKLRTLLKKNDSCKRGKPSQPAFDSYNNSVYQAEGGIVTRQDTV